MSPRLQSRSDSIGETAMLKTESAFPLPWALPLPCASWASSFPWALLSNAPRNSTDRNFPFAWFCFALSFSLPLRSVYSPKYDFWSIVLWLQWFEARPWLLSLQLSQARRLCFHGRIEDSHWCLHSKIEVSMVELKIVVDVSIAELKEISYGE